MSVSAQALVARQKLLAEYVQYKTGQQHSVAKTRNGALIKNFWEQTPPPQVEGLRALVQRRMASAGRALGAGVRKFFFSME